MIGQRSCAVERNRSSAIMRQTNCERGTASGSAASRPSPPAGTGHKEQHLEDAHWRVDCLGPGIIRINAKLRELALVRDGG